MVFVPLISLFSECLNGSAVYVEPVTGIRYLYNIIPNCATGAGVDSTETGRFMSGKKAITIIN